MNGEGEAPLSLDIPPEESEVLANGNRMMKMSSSSISFSSTNREEELREENHRLMERLRLVEEENEQLREQLKRQCTENFYQEVADILCEELVLLDDDISFISKMVKPKPTDPYSSNLGRKQRHDTPPPKDIRSTLNDPPKSLSVNELLMEERLSKNESAQSPKTSLYAVEEEDDG